MPTNTNMDAVTPLSRKHYRYITAGGITDAIRLDRPVRINALPRSGATIRVFKSSSAWPDIQADIDAGRLTYANFNGGNLSTLSSNWFEWATGPVTYSASVPARSESQIDAAGWSAVLAISTGADANLEVIE